MGKLLLFLVSVIFMVWCLELEVLVTDASTGLSWVKILPNEESVFRLEEKHGEKYVERRYLTSESHLKYFSPQNINRRSVEEEGTSSLDFKRYEYDEIVTLLQTITSRDEVCSLHNLGKSASGKDIYFVKIGTNEDVPEVEYVANIHGDEVIGVSNTLHLINYLCENFERGKLPEASVEQKRVKELLSNVNLYVIPTINPDGYANKRRTNSNGYDLNRNFPDQFGRHSNPLQPESELLMHFADDKPNLILGAHFHGGAVCVSYPFDGSKNGGSVYSKTEDDTLYKYLALLYSEANAPMYASREFSQGITNGADWYALYGGIQDYQYLEQDIWDFTIELSAYKQPPESQYEKFWDDNLNSMLLYAEAAFKLGVSGRVTNHKDEPIKNAVISIEGNGKTIKTNENGYFWRLITPGTYTLTVKTTNTEVSHHVVVKSGVQTVMSIVVNEDDTTTDPTDDDKDDDDDEGSVVEDDPVVDGVLYTILAVVSVIGISILCCVFLVICVLIVLHLRKNGKKSTNVVQYTTLQQKELEDDEEEFD